MRTLKLIFAAFCCVLLAACAEDRLMIEETKLPLDSLYGLPETQAMLEEYNSWLETASKLSIAEQIAGIAEREKAILDYLTGRCSEPVSPKHLVQFMRRAFNNGTVNMQTRSAGVEDLVSCAFDQDRYWSSVEFYMNGGYDDKFLTFIPNEEEEDFLNYLNWHDLGSWVYIPGFEAMLFEKDREPEEMFDNLLGAATVFAPSHVSIFIGAITGMIASTSYTIFGSINGARLIIDKLKTKNYMIGSHVEWVYPKAYNLSLETEISFAWGIRFGEGIMMRDFYWMFMEAMDDILFELWQNPLSSPHYNSDIFYYDMTSIFNLEHCRGGGINSMGPTIPWSNPEPEPEPTPMPKIIIDPSFENTKAECVYDKIKNTGLMTELLKEFAGSEVYDVTYNVVSSLIGENGQQSYGRTSPISGTNKWNILINSYYFEKNVPVFIAKTIMHETIHAALKQEVASVGGLEGLNADNFEELYRYYNHYGTDYEHKYMAAFYVPVLAQALAQLDNNKYPLSYYEAISWSGLWESYEWQSMTQSERDAIYDKIEEFNMGAKTCVW